MSIRSRSNDIFAQDIILHVHTFMHVFYIFYQHHFVSINDNVYIFYTKSLSTYVHSTTLLFVFYVHINF